MTRPFSLRSMLVATDLGSGSDTLVRSASNLAARSGARLHLLHSLDHPLPFAERPPASRDFQGQIDQAAERLREQVERTVPGGVEVASRRVVARRPHDAIPERAKEVSADLIVMGPHSRGAVGTLLLGSTADRVLRTVDVPCLVIREPLSAAVRRVGVPVDFSDASRGGLEIALEWAVAMDGAEAGSGGAPDIDVMHVARSGDSSDPSAGPEPEDDGFRPRLEREVEIARSHVPGSDALEVGIEVVRASRVPEATRRWVEDRGVDLLVMGTHGAHGLKRTLIGSTASRMARGAPVPVLLVPPSLWRRREDEPRLERVVGATDFGEASLDVIRWSTEVLAPEADHLLVHVLEVPEPPSLLAGRFGSREELLRTVRTGAEDRIGSVREEMAAQKEGGEGRLRTEVRQGRPAEEIVRVAEASDADVIVMGTHGPGEEDRGPWQLLGSTAERVLRASSTPILIAREVEPTAPRGILVPVDGSEASLQALGWGRFLSRRYEVPMTALYVETPAIYQYADMIPSSTDPSLTGGEGVAGKAGWVSEREGWLRDQVRRAGVELGAVSTRIAVGRPADEILAARDQVEADVIVMGSRGAGTVGRAILGSVATEVLREAGGPVLVVKA